MLPAVSRRRPVAAGVAVAFALTIATGVCAAPVVTSCADDGSPGTLRYTVLAANENDTVDVSQLQCTITLQTGAINVNQNNLIIDGPGAGMLTIDAAGNSRVFFHSGTGRLRLYRMTLANGHVSGDRAIGGCVYSQGSLGVNDSVVTGCSATATTTAGGGGVFATADLFLGSSIVTGNTAETNAAPGVTGYAIGGGAASVGQLRLSDSRLSGNHAHVNYGMAFGGGGYAATLFESKYSTIDGNVADTTIFDTHYSFGIGGGIIFGRNTPATSFDLRYSTVSHNHADGAAGLFISSTGTGHATIYDSTVSANTATVVEAGIAVGIPLKLFNSTIAFNTAGSYGGGGLVVQGASLQMSSTIIADNSPGGSQFAADFTSDAAITGDHNLVRFASGTALPMDTLRVDPMLGALRDNGGPTYTHALLPGSPAIDKGSNPKNLLTDQRRFGFDRAIGVTDIGAYEYDPDVIFVSGFE
jgi:hypothetical protein